LSPILKVISALQFSPWKFQKLCLGPFPLPPARLPALFFSAGYRRRCAVPPAHRGRASRPPLLCAGTHASLRSFSTALGLALVPPPFATPPRTASRSPPRHRRGGLAAAPHSLLSRVHEHYKHPIKLFLWSFCQFLHPTPQNSTAAPLELQRAPPRRRHAISEPLRPNRPRQ